jgi:hypothetical protein
MKNSGTEFHERSHEESDGGFNEVRPSLSHPRKILDKHGIFYSPPYEDESGIHKEEIIDSEMLFPGILKNPLHERLLLAMNEMHIHFNLLSRCVKLSRASHSAGLDGFKDLRQFVEKWDEEFRKMTFLNGIYHNEEICFPARTETMRDSLQKIRLQPEFNVRNRFVVVLGGKDHLETPLKLREQSHYDLTPLYQELQHHQAVILIHSCKNAFS